jgi:aspartyl-tRNA(Asn)/glutamyl-tRNA(Gln) amidotransferase subunit C
MATQKKISQEEVKKIAQLARLKLSEEETRRATEDLASILGYFSAIQNVDTTQVTEEDNASGQNNATRRDGAKPNELATAEDLVKAAPRSKGAHVQVPAVFE